MEKFPKLNSINPHDVDVPSKEQVLADLAELIKKPQGTEKLVGTFQAGCIPVILDTLARDTSEAGQTIVTAIYKMITDLKVYYASREKNKENKKKNEVEEKKLD